MIDFQLTEEQKQLQAWAHEFAAKEMRPIAHEYDEREEMPFELLQKAAQHGFINYGLPEEYGGGGITSAMTHLLIGEELFWGCAGIATAITINALAAMPIVMMGSDAQKQKYLPRFCATDRLHLGAYALTEPEAGSDAAAIKTRAVRHGDHYILNGQKRFITNGGIANTYIVFATLDPIMGYAGITPFIVEAEWPGVKAGRKEKKMGIRASHTGDVIFEDVEVPCENRLGEEGWGFVGAMKVFEATRPSVAIGAVGVARAAYEYAVQYAKERVAFGKPIITKQAIRFMLADMLMNIDAARLLAWRAAWLIDQGQSNNLEASIAKAFAADMAQKVTTDAVQVLGGYGYMRDYPVEKWMRDAKIMQIYEGTSQIQREV
ncbi:MAG: acyl-CoA dehydrogenase family protein, partial [Chloroflexota bacterium]